MYKIEGKDAVSAQIETKVRAAAWIGRQLIQMEQQQQKAINKKIKISCAELNKKNI